MCTYLHRAPNGRYYFRMSIPVKLRPFFGGKREIKEALHTSDQATAKPLIPSRTIAALKSLDEARAAAISPPLPASPVTQAQQKWEQARWEHEQDQAKWESEELERREHEAEVAEPLVQQLAQRFANPAAELSPIEDAAKRLLADAQFEAVIANERLGIMAGQSREVMARPASAQLRRAVAPPQPKGESLYLDTDIVEGWADERRPGAKGKVAYASSVKLFHSVMGRKSVALITKADVMAYKNKLMAEGRSQKNVRNQLAYIRTLFDWAAQQDLIPANPVQNVRMRVTEKSAKRQDWNIDDLNALFGGSVHAKGERPKLGAGGEAAYWMPLLALFMGARREELGQLRISDVKQEPYVDRSGQRQQAWCINITETTDDGETLTNQIKNENSRRLIPLHPKLIALGFISYVQGLPDRKGRVFPALKPAGIDKKLTDKWGQWFSSYKRDCGVTDRLKVFHSFRHTWKTHAVEVGMPERICRAFQGHRGIDVADDYGKAAPSMLMLVEAISSYEVRGLEIPDAQRAERLEAD